MSTLNSKLSAAPINVKPTTLWYRKRAMCGKRVMVAMHTKVVYWDCNERHDSTFGQSIDPKERHVSTDGFQYTKNISKFGY